MPLVRGLGKRREGISVSKRVDVCAAGNQCFHNSPPILEGGPVKERPASQARSQVRVATIGEKLEHRLQGTLVEESVELIPEGLVHGSDGEVIGHSLSTAGP